MKINYRKLQIAMAEACINALNLCDRAEISHSCYSRIVRGYECKPVTVGKIAKVLNVPVTEIIED